MSYPGGCTENSSARSTRGNCLIREPELMGYPLPSSFRIQTETTTSSSQSEHWKIAKKRNDDASIQKKKKGRPTKNTDFASTRESMAYIQDELGNPVTEARAREICNEACKVFSKLEELGMAPRTWTKISSVLQAGDVWIFSRIAILRGGLEGRTLRN